METSQLTGMTPEYSFSPQGFTVIARATDSSVPGEPMNSVFTGRPGETYETCNPDGVADYDAPS